MIGAMYFGQNYFGQGYEANDSGPSYLPHVINNYQAIHTGDGVSASGGIR